MIGVDPFIYHNSQDKMGNHADDDQGEKKICALLVAGAKARKVKIQMFTHLEPIEGDKSSCSWDPMMPMSWMDKCNNPISIVFCQILLKRIKTMPNELQLSFEEV
jgi:hypothetical protein